MLSVFCKYILAMSISSTIIIIVILSLRLLIKLRMPRLFYYSLWLIVFCRLSIPFSIKSKLSIFNILPTGLKNTIKTNSSFNNFNQSLYNSKVYLNYNADNNYSLNLIYLLVLSILFLFIIYMYYHTTKKFDESIICKKNDLFEKCKHTLSVSKPQLYTSNYLHIPIVHGLFNPKIIIPTEFMKNYDDKDLASIFLHELIHIKRLDYIIKPLFLVVVLFHWFNPLAWVSFFLFQKDMESSCDERVIRLKKYDCRSEYAKLLIKLAPSDNSFVKSLLLAFSHGHIKQRIISVMNMKKKCKFKAITSLGLFIVLSLVLLTNNVNDYKAPVLNKRVQDIAISFVNDDIEQYTRNQQMKRVNTQIIRLEKIDTYRQFSSELVEVYAFEYEINLNENTSTLDYSIKNTSLHKESKLESVMIIVKEQDNTTKLIGVTWRVAIDHQGGMIRS